MQIVSKIFLAYHTKDKVYHLAILDKLYETISAMLPKLRIFYNMKQGELCKKIDVSATGDIITIKYHRENILKLSDKDSSF